MRSWERRLSYKKSRRDGGAPRPQRLKFLMRRWIDNSGVRQLVVSTMILSKRQSIFPPAFCVAINFTSFPSLSGTGSAVLSVDALSLWYFLCFPAKSRGKLPHSKPGTRPPQFYLVPGTEKLI
jgi:hypothetical protein